MAVGVTMQIKLLFVANYVCDCMLPPWCWSQGCQWTEHPERKSAPRDCGPCLYQWDKLKKGQVHASKFLVSWKINEKYSKLRNFPLSHVNMYRNKRIE